MFKFEFTSDKQGKSSLLIDGILYSNHKEINYFLGERYIRIYADEIVNAFLAHNFIEIGEYFDSISYILVTEWWGEPLNITVDCKNKPLVRIELSATNDEWANKDFLGFTRSIFDIVEESESSDLKYYQSNTLWIGYGFGVEFICEGMNSNIGDKVQDSLLRMEEIYNEANVMQATIYNRDKVITVFNFPESFKTSCQQYLMYFAQFLQDLGIEVETEISEQLHQTLFKIIPKDKSEALSKIKEALNIYISAPSLNDFELQKFSSNDVAAMQWQSNILHLKSQIMLANATIQFKDATIENLKLTNYQQKQVIKGLGKDDKNEIEIVNDLVTLKKYDGKWFSINLPKILKILKRNFSG